MAQRAGVEAHLIDITPGHIAAARAGIASAEIGDARCLGWEDSSADAVLLFGPLYHLTEAGDRALALREARRVAVRRVGLRRRDLPVGSAARLAGGRVLRRQCFRRGAGQGPEDGQHRNTTGDFRRFTTAYFHRPDDLVEEIRAAGLELAQMVAVEGPCWLALGSRAGFAECWSDGLRRERLLELARKVERDPLALAVSPHAIAVGRAGDERLG